MFASWQVSTDFPPPHDARKRVSGAFGSTATLSSAGCWPRLTPTVPFEFAISLMLHRGRLSWRRLPRLASTPLRAPQEGQHRGLSPKHGVPTGNRTPVFTVKGINSCLPVSTLVH